MGTTEVVVIHGRVVFMGMIVHLSGNILWQLGRGDGGKVRARNTVLGTISMETTGLLR